MDNRNINESLKCAEEIIKTSEETNGSFIVKLTMFEEGINIGICSKATLKYAMD